MRGLRTRADGYLDEERGHPLSGVVVLAHGMDHLDGADEGRDGIQHALGVTLVERLVELLQGVEVLEIVSCLVGGVSDLRVQLLPRLRGRKE